MQLQYRFSLSFIGFVQEQINFDDQLSGFTVIRRQIFTVFDPHTPRVIPGVGWEGGGS